jgi:hypothetical protein
LQPQATGSNPFRQSMFVPQSTGVSSSPFAMGNQTGPFQPRRQNSVPLQAMPSPFALSPFPAAGGSTVSSALPSSALPFSQNPAAQAVPDLPARPASTPLTSFGSGPSSSKSPPEAQPVKSHQTGSRNPFGIPVAPAPPVPKAPTLMELAMGGGSTNSSMNDQHNGANVTQPQLQHTNGFGSFGGGVEGKGDMASVASSFSFKNDKVDNNISGLPNSSGTFPFLNSQNTATTGSGFSDSVYSSLNSQPTAATTTSNPPSVSLSPTLKPQTTGFSGLKPFKPSSSFGTSLLESLPPIPSSSPNYPSTGNAESPAAATSTPTSAPGGMHSFGTAASAFTSQPMGMNSQGTTPSFGGFGGGSSLGTNLQPQITAAANPFRASAFNALGGPMNGSAGPFPSSTSSPSAFGGSGGNFSPGLSSSNGISVGTFGGGSFGSAFNTSGGPQDPSKQQQPQQIGSTSLI